MVHINNQKFACEACIKGHRSSSCTHNDRPLFEVKKKGRPVSQCEKCRELRKTKRVHAKCICDPEKAEKAVRPLHATAKRFIPILPSLPNGLKDAFVDQSTNLHLPDSRARVDALLNPCHCKDIWSCKCPPATISPSSSIAFKSRESKLATLALAAESLCCSSASSADLIEGGGEGSSSLPNKRSRGCCESTPKGRSKRLNRQPSKQTPTATISERILLPPIMSPPLISIADSASSPPVFPDIPPMSSIVQLAGSGCTCGFDCSCPGCVEHRGKENTSSEHDDCPDGCGTCVDHQHGLELPKATPFGCIPSDNAGKEPDFLEAFFARAAAIPPPPPGRANARRLDPTNVTTYPASLFVEAKTLDEHGHAFGLVRLPKLSCCAGRCGCPGDGCGCGTSCDGCCSREDRDIQGPSNMDSSTSVEEPSVSPVIQASTQFRSRCCG